jgi:hypothetical protein
MSGVLPRYPAPERCVACEIGTFYAKGDRAERPGHIYSPAGLSELQLSGVCECCFDRALAGQESWLFDRTEYLL